MAAKIQMGRSYELNFWEKCAKAPNGCRSWTGGYGVRVPVDMQDEVGSQNISYRKMAYLLKHGEVPACEIKLICHTERCANPEHFVLGRKHRHPKQITHQLKRDILKSLKTKSWREVAEEFGISKTTISRIVKESQKEG